MVAIFAITFAKSDTAEGANLQNVQSINSENQGDKDMKNTLTDLNNYLFEQIERQNDDELTDEQLEKEIRRSDAVGKIAKTIIDNGALALQARKHFDEYGNDTNVEIPLLGITSK